MFGESCPHNCSANGFFFPYFKGVDEKSAGGSPAKAEEQGEEIDKNNPILCGGCRHPVTSPDERIEVNSRHQHTFYNPEGVIFQIGCFASARGCLTTGSPSFQFTWFPGFAWSYAHCLKCSLHLGWFFQSGSREGFFGLILNKLVQIP